MADDDIWEDFDALLWLRSKQRQYSGYDPDSQENIQHQYFKAAADELEQLRNERGCYLCSGPCHSPDGHAELKRNG